MSTVDDIVEKIKKEFDSLTADIPLSDYVDVCSELAGDFEVRAEAAQHDLDSQDEE